MTSEICSALLWGVSLFVVLMLVAVQSSDLVTLKSGRAVSKLGIGTWAWGDKFFWKYNPSEDAGLQETFDYCVKEGKVNLFDTAEVYGLGRSELLLGRFKRQIGEEAESVYTATKFAPLPWRFGSDAVVAACQESLDRMGVDSMDLYQLHWPAAFGQNEAYWQGIAECYNKGLVKTVGVSNYGPKLLRECHAFLDKRGVPLSTNQIQFSLLSRGAESNGLLKTARELDIKIMAYSPLAQGILTGKFTKDNLPQGPRKVTTRQLLDKAEPLLKHMRGVAQAKSEATGLEVSLSQVALNWAIAKGSIPIPGARTIKQAKDNCATLKWELTAEEVSMLDGRAAATGISIPTPLQGK